MESAVGLGEEEFSVGKEFGSDFATAEPRMMMEVEFVVKRGFDMPVVAELGRLLVPSAEEFAVVIVSVDSSDFVTVAEIASVVAGGLAAVVGVWAAGSASWASASVLDRAGTAVPAGTGIAGTLAVAAALWPRGSYYRLG